MLAGRRLLLVLDNCEHVIEAAAHLAEHLLATAPGVALLATSREPLAIAGETLFPLPPLALPAEGADPRTAPAVALFADRAAAVRPGFTVGDDVVRVCRELDGIPLAIELAAARLRSLTPGRLAERIGDRFGLLDHGSRTALPRHRTLRAVVDWSWELLNEDERSVLRRLSVFYGGATAEAVARVCDHGDPVDLLAGLVDKSLLILADDAAGVRYRLLETVREYAAERLEQAGEAEAVRAAHTAYFLEFAEAADPKLRGREQLEWLARLDADHGNLDAVPRDPDGRVFSTIRKSTPRRARSHASVSPVGPAPAMSTCVMPRTVSSAAVISLASPASPDTELSRIRDGSPFRGLRRGEHRCDAGGVSTVITNIGELAGAVEGRWLVEDAALVIDGDRVVWAGEARGRPGGRRGVRR